MGSAVYRTHFCFYLLFGPELTLNHRTFCSDQVKIEGDAGFTPVVEDVVLSSQIIHLTTTMGQLCVEFFVCGCGGGLPEAESLPSLCHCLSSLVLIHLSSGCAFVVTRS